MSNNKSQTPSDINAILRSDKALETLKKLEHLEAKQEKLRLELLQSTVLYAVYPEAFEHGSVTVDWHKSNVRLGSPRGYYSTDVIDYGQLTDQKGNLYLLTYEMANRMQISTEDRNVLSSHLSIYKEQKLSVETAIASIYIDNDDMNTSTSDYTG